MATKPKRPRDINQLAHLIGQIAPGEIKEELESDTRNVFAVELGASKGGKARAKSLNKKERVAIAKKEAKKQ